MPGMLFAFAAASRIREMFLSTAVELIVASALAAVDLGKDGVASIVVAAGDVGFVKLELAGALCSVLLAAPGSRFLFAGLALCATTNVTAAAPTITATNRITMRRAVLLAMGFCCWLFFIAWNVMNTEQKVLIAHLFLRAGNSMAQAYISRMRGGRRWLWVVGRQRTI